MKYKKLHDKPKIFLFQDFLSVEEIDALLKLAEGGYRDSTVVDVETSLSKKDVSRTGQISVIKHEGELSRAILSRLAKECGQQIEQCESLQIVKYGPGDQYMPHTDWFDPRLPAARALFKNGGQRIFSAIIGLKKAEQGGATYFPELRKSIILKPGEALIFEDVKFNGSPEPLTLHGSSPVVLGEKIVCTAWLRERAYNGSQEAPEGMAFPSDVKAMKAFREDNCMKALPEFLASYGCALNIVSVPFIDDQGFIQVETEVKAVALDAEAPKEEKHG